MRNVTLGSIFLFTLGCLTLTITLPQKSHAIPAFTRQHKTECFTCHTIFPELTEQGDNFRRNSFVWLDTKGSKTGTIKKDDKKNGTKGLNEREYLTLSSIPDAVPLSVLGTFNASYADYRKEDDGNRVDLATRAITLDAGGSLNDRLGVWLSYNLYSEGVFNHTTASSTINANVPANNIPDLNEAFVQARHVFKSPVNLKVGRFTPTMSLWKTTNKTSLVSPLATTSYRAGDSPYYVNAATDGIEINAILGGRFAVAAGSVKHKDQKNLAGYGSIHFKLGGADFVGREAPVNLDAEESILDYLSLTVGAYGYAGNNNPGAFRQLNEFYRYGLESDIRYKRARLKLASAFGRDDNPIVSSGFPAGMYVRQDSQVFAAESLYLLGSEVIPSIRFEYEDNGPATVKRIIPSVAYAALQNAKLVFEYKWETFSDHDNNTVNLSLTACF